MTKKSTQPFIDPSIAAYCEAHCTPESETLSALHAFTAERRSDYAHNLSGRSVGQLLRLLVATSAATRILDVGTFTGYSALAMAEASVPNAQVISLDANPLSQEYAKPFLAQSPAGHKVTLITCFVQAWLPEQCAESFDFIFLDADKHRYPEYLEACWRLLASGGLLVADNILWGGGVTDEQPSSRAQAVDQFNKAVLTLEGAIAVCLPLRDGVMVVRKPITNPESGRFDCV
jgi:caffeoyl-CoA O-methyltransferase